VWILRSYRWRRRLIKVAVLAAAIGLIVVGVRLSTPGHEQNANGPNVRGYTQPKTVPFTRANQRAVNRVLNQFARTAVARKDIAKSWDLAAPSFRSGFSRKAWNSGALPVTPYPATGAQWTLVDYSYKKTLGVEVVVFPRPGSGQRRMAVSAELVKGRKGNWLVDYWMPQQFQGPATVSKSAAPGKHKQTRSAHGTGQAKKAAPSTQPVAGTRRQSRLWWAVPIVILSLIVVVPVSLGLAGWYRDRRAQRAYARESR
jgi:hypothetical protein